MRVAPLPPSLPLRARAAIVTLLGLLAALDPADPSILAAAAVRTESEDGSAAARHYREGRRLLASREREGMLESVGELEAAVSADPEHVLAWAGLAEASALLALYAVVEPHATLPRARDAARRALELDDSLAEAHAVLGLVRYLYDWDYASAEASFRRALELDPAYAEAAHWYAMLLAATARGEEAAAMIDRALVAEPDSRLLATKRGTVLTAANRLDEAEIQLRRTRERFPEYALVHRELGFLALRRHATSSETDDLETALDAFRRAAELSGDEAKASSGLAFALAALGQRREARQLLDTMRRASTDSFVSPMALALAHLGLGERELALRSLERAAAMHDPGLVYLAIKPGFEGLYGEPRFRALIERIGLPPPRAAAPESR